MRRAGLDIYYGLKWNRSASYYECAICEGYATQDIDGLGPGIYNPNGLSLPLDHPNGLCFVTSVLKESPKLPEPTPKAEPEKPAFEMPETREQIEKKAAKVVADMVPEPGQSRFTGRVAYDIPTGGVNGTAHWDGHISMAKRFKAYFEGMARKAKTAKKNNLKGWLFKKSEGKAFFAEIGDRRTAESLQVYLHELFHHYGKQNLRNDPFVFGSDVIARHFEEGLVQLRTRQEYLNFVKAMFGDDCISESTAKGISYIVEPGWNIFSSYDDQANMLKRMIVQACKHKGMSEVEYTKWLHGSVEMGDRFAFLAEDYIGAMSKGRITAVQSVKRFESLRKGLERELEARVPHLQEFLDRFDKSLS
jgi:hypothetical protein